MNAMAISPIVQLVPLREQALVEQTMSSMCRQTRDFVLKRPLLLLGPVKWKPAWIDQFLALSTFAPMPLPMRTMISSLL